MTDLFGGDWRRMCVVLDEAVRPTGSSRRLTTPSTRAGCRWSSRASRTSSGLSGSSWRGRRGAERPRGRRADDVCQAERGRADAIVDGLPQRRPGDGQADRRRVRRPPRRACAVNLLQTEPRSLRALSVSAPIEFFHLVGRVIHTEPLPNDATGVCELRHAPGAVAQAFAGRKNALPLVQHNCRRTIADPAVLAFAEHPICDADVLFRAVFYQPALDSAPSLPGLTASPGRAVERERWGGACVGVLRPGKFSFCLSSNDLFQCLFFEPSWKTFEKTKKLQLCRRMFLGPKTFQTG